MQNNCKIIHDFYAIIMKLSQKRPTHELVKLLAYLFDWVKILDYLYRVRRYNLKIIYYASDQTNYFHIFKCLIIIQTVQTNKISCISIPKTKLNIAVKFFVTC